MPPLSHDAPVPAPDWPDSSKRFAVLGIPVDGSGFAATVAGLLAAPARQQRLSIHFTTAHLLTEAKEDERVAAALQAPDAVVTADGMPLVWLGRRAGLKTTRVYGPDTMLALLDRGRAQGARHFFFGGAPGVAEELKRRMEERFPGLEVVGTHSPPFRPAGSPEDPEVIEAINAARPDYVWVGLGAPKQDLWVFNHRPLVNATALLAVGAAFDFHAGLTRQAPPWLRNRGGEWAFRLAMDPRRLWKRYTVSNARFVTALARERLGRRR